MSQGYMDNTEHCHVDTWTTQSTARWIHGHQQHRVTQSPGEQTDCQSAVNFIIDGIVQEFTFPIKVFAVNYLSAAAIYFIEIK